MVTGMAVLALNLFAGIWGAVAWARRDPSVWFWYFLRVAQAAVVVQVTLGLILLGSGHRVQDELHYAYGVALLLVTFVTEGMRAGAAQRELQDVEDPDELTPDEKRTLARRVVLREMGVMTIGLLLVSTLALRAATTGS